MCLTRCCADPTPRSHSQFGVLTYPSLLPWSNNSAQTVLLINVSLWSNTEVTRWQPGRARPLLLWAPLCLHSLMSQFPFGFSMNFNSQWYVTEALNKRAKLFGRSANSLHPQSKCKHLPIACTPMAFLMPLVLDMLPTHRTKPDPTGSNGLLSASHPPFPLQPLPDLLLLSQRDRERCLHSPPGHNLSCLRLTPTYWGSGSGFFFPDWIPHNIWELSHPIP